MDFGYKVTSNGRELLTTALETDGQITITKVQFGSGLVSESQDLAEVHSLLNYVADGTLANRYHDGDKLTCDIEYNNSLNPNTAAFNLTEFMIYAKVGDTEQDFLYATLGDYPMGVPQYEDGVAASVYRFEVILTITDEVTVYVTADRSGVTYDELEQAIQDVAAQYVTAARESAENAAESESNAKASETNAKTSETNAKTSETNAASSASSASTSETNAKTSETNAATSESNAASSESNAAESAAEAESSAESAANSAALAEECAINSYKISQIDFTLSTWTEISGNYKYSCTVADDTVTADSYPAASVDFASLAAAIACGMATAVDSSDGYLTFYAQAIPSSTITGTCLLYTKPESTSGLTVVTDIGNGLKLEGGTLSVDIPDNDTYNTDLEAII